MNLRVTVTSKEEEEIIIANIKPGIVFKYGIGGPIVLKLGCNKVLLLTYSNGDAWLELNDNSFSCSNIIILGRLDEIIVVKE